MFIHGYIPKSKKKKVPKAVQQQNQEWLYNISKMKTNFSRNVSNVSKMANKPFPTLGPPPGRETLFIASKNPHNMAPCTKKDNNVYTGDKMIGIGTLHKSNAVPVFSSEEASDMAKMRR